MMYDRQSNSFNMAQRVVNGSRFLQLVREGDVVVLMGTTPDYHDPHPITLASWVAA